MKFWNERARPRHLAMPPRLREASAFFCMWLVAHFIRTFATGFSSLSHVSFAVPLFARFTSFVYRGRNCRPAEIAAKNGTLWFRIGILLLFFTLALPRLFQRQFFFLFSLRLLWRDVLVVSRWLRRCCCCYLVLFESRYKSTRSIAVQLDTIWMVRMGNATFDELKEN